MKDLTNLLDYYLVEYDNKNDYLEHNSLDKEDFNEWEKQGYSDDGTLQIDTCYWLAGNAAAGKYMPITTKAEILKLLFCTIDESNFRDTIDLLNQDAEECGRDDLLVDINDKYEVLETYLEYVREIAIFSIEDGNELVIDCD